MSVAYPTLAGEIAKRGIKKSIIAERIGLSQRSLYNKLSGSVSFTWDEAMTITKIFFPDLDPTALFERNDNTGDDPHDPE
jgi:hypothetical protein